MYASMCGQTVYLASLELSTQRDKIVGGLNMSVFLCEWCLCDIVINTCSAISRTEDAA